MFKAIKKWWNGLWVEEPSPGPKITRENIAKVEEMVKEIRSGKFGRAQPSGSDVECLTKATGPGYGREYVNQDGRAAPVHQPKPKPIPSPENGIKVVHLHAPMTVSRGVGGMSVEVPGSTGKIVIDTIERPVENGLGGSTDFTTVERNGCVAHIDANGHLKPIGMDHDGHMPPNPTDKTILPGIETMFIAEPGIQAAQDGRLVRTLGEPGEPYFNEPVVGKINVDYRAMDEMVAERLTNPQVIKIGLEDLDGDTPVPTTRKPRRRGKRGGVKRNRRNKTK